MPVMFFHLFTESFPVPMLRENVSAEALYALCEHDAYTVVLD